MFIGVNLVQVNPGREADFEEGFRQRAGLVERMPGFLAFEIWRPVDGREYVVMTRWRSRQDHDAWIRSPEFMAAHGRAGSGIVAGARVQFYEVIESVAAKAERR